MCTVYCYAWRGYLEIYSGPELEKDYSIVITKREKLNQRKINTKLFSS